MLIYNPLRTLKPQTPEGHAGPYAHINLPFYGHWFPSGQQYTFNTGELVQRGSSVTMGLTRPDTFQKDCCGCKGALTAVV